MAVAVPCTPEFSEDAQRRLRLLHPVSHDKFTVLNSPDQQEGISKLRDHQVPSDAADTN